jgi:hypothetical protein
MQHPRVVGGGTGPKGGNAGGGEGGIGNKHLNHEGHERSPKKKNKFKMSAFPAAHFQIHWDV